MVRKRPMLKKLFLAVVAAMLFPLVAHADFVLVGSRSTPISSGVVADDGWTDASGGFTISWVITGSSGSWEYSYTIDTADGPDLSHWLLEVSPMITAENVGGYIFNFNTDPSDPSDPDPPFEGPEWWGPSYDQGNNNPNMPADLWGINIDIDIGFEGSSHTFTFESTQQPVWGSFYANDGQPQGDVWATAWNTGIGTDPESSATDFTNWIPVPDTTAGGGPPIIPEPTSLLLLALGASSVLGFGRFRRGRKQS